MRLRCPNCKQVVQFQHEEAESGECDVVCQLCDSAWHLSFDPTHPQHKYNDLDRVKVVVEPDDGLIIWNSRPRAYSTVAKSPRHTPFYTLVALICIVALVVFSYFLRPDLYGREADDLIGAEVVANADNSTTQGSETGAVREDQAPSGSGDSAEEVGDDEEADDSDDAQAKKSKAGVANSKGGRAGSRGKNAKRRTKKRAPVERAAQDNKPDNRSVDELISDAQQLRKEGKTRDAITVYSKALQRDNDNMSVRFELGKLFYQTGAFARARETLRRVIQYGGPTEPEAILISARAEHKLGRQVNARELYSEYLSRFPNGSGRSEAEAYTSNQ